MIQCKVKGSGGTHGSQEIKLIVLVTGEGSNEENHNILFKATTTRNKLFLNRAMEKATIFCTLFP